MPFTSHLKIGNVGTFHPRLHEVFDPNTKSHLKGDAMPIEASSPWPSDHFAITNDLETAELEPHVKWLKQIVEAHLNLFSEIKNSGGVIELSVLNFILKREEGQVFFSEQLLKDIHEAKVELRFISFFFGASGGKKPSL